MTGNDDLHADKLTLGRGDLDSVIEGYRDSLRQYVHGDPEPTMRFWSSRDDVSLANPVGPAVRGPEAVDEAARRAGSSFQEGGALRFGAVSIRFDEISRVVTPDLAYLLETERTEGTVPGREEPVVITLRTTLVFRREEGTWKVVHRHADPITTPRPIETMVQQ
jgi:ketosteroid isomerase-like protein